MHRTRRRLAFISLIAASMLCACGPEGASPMPEPPALEIGDVGPSDVYPLVSPNPVTFEGAPGAATNATLLRVTDLDGTAPVVVTTVRPDGSFSISLAVNPNDELRFQAVSDTARGAPVDVTYVANPPALVPVVRPACVELDPGYELDFPAASGKAIGIVNHCAAAIALGTPTTRLALGDFVVTAAAASIPVGGTANLTVAFAPTGAGQREDVLFLPIDVAGRTVRYPVTLFGPTAP